MHVLGGLATCDPPRRPLPTFWTVAGGPLVNVVICAIAAAAVYFLTPTAHQIWSAHNGGMAARHFVESLNPFASFLPPVASYSVATWHWTFRLSYTLLLFNLLPIFPLDGGQMLQTVLWPKMGYFRSMYLSTIVGMVGAVVLALFGLYELNPFMLCVALLGFFICRGKRMELLESSDGGLLMGSMDYGASIYAQPAPENGAGSAVAPSVAVAKSPPKNAPNAIRSIGSWPRSRPRACTTSPGGSDAPYARPPKNSENEMKSCNDWVWANDPAPGRGAIVRRVFAGPITESGRRLGRPVARI